MSASHPPRPAMEMLERRALLSAALLVDLGPGQLHTTPSELIVFNDHVYFRAGHQSGDGVGAAHWWLWRTDGTPDGTEAVAIDRKGITPGYWNPHNWGANTWSGLRDLVVAQERLFAYEIQHETSMVLHVYLRSF